MVPAWDGTPGHTHDHNHDHDHGDKSTIVRINLWNKHIKWAKTKSANPNKHKLIRNWQFLNGHLCWFYKSWQKNKSKK